jgi:glycosyltransferase involved in cell wall biosynthesis
MTLTQTVEPVAPPRRPRRVAVMPAFNEEKTVVGVLERLLPLADDIIVVDDGSRDRTRELVLNWAADRPNVRLICFQQNRGMSAAYYRAFEEVARRVAAGQLGPDDVVLTVDADGQHEPEEVDDLVAYLVENRLDGVIARRDLSRYTLYKKAGNFLMSLWASLWAGQRLYDVESGYRVFRVGALLSALRYYKGYKYSETVEVAVILVRLGYRIDNTYLVPVPIFRSNTRLKDVVIDLAAIPAAFWRVTTRRAAPAGISRALAYSLPALVPALLGFMAIDVLRSSLFLGNDSMQHYSHVWYVSDQLFHHGRLPLRIASLDGGNAVAFPYGFLPYIGGALLYPLFGDWATTLLLVVGALGLVLAACLARPALRDPWFLLLFVINPFFIDSIYSFQFASVWSLLFFFLFVWRFEAGRTRWPVVLAWMTATTHPIMGLSCLALYGLLVAGTARGELRRLLATYTVAVAASVPFFWMSLATPALAENSVLKVVLSVADTVSRRGTIALLPLALPYAGQWVKSHYRASLAGMAGFAVAGLVFSAGIVHFGDLNRGTYAGAFHRSHDMYGAFFASDAFRPGAVYRVVEPTEREDGAYRFMRRGAVLSNEFFNESMVRLDWTEAGFACYAAYKGIDYDVVEAAYLAEYHKNEAAVLETLAAAGRVSVVYSDPRGRFRVYDLRPLTTETPRPASIRECQL